MSSEGAAYDNVCTESINIENVDIDMSINARKFPKSRNYRYITLRNVAEAEAELVRRRREQWGGEEVVFSTVVTAPPAPLRASYPPTVTPRRRPERQGDNPMTDDRDRCGGQIWHYKISEIIFWQGRAEGMSIKCALNLMSEGESMTYSPAPGDKRTTAAPWMTTVTTNITESLMVSPHLGTFLGHLARSPGHHHHTPGLLTWTPHYTRLVHLETDALLTAHPSMCWISHGLFFFSHKRPYPGWMCSTHDPW